MSNEQKMREALEEIISIYGASSIAGLISEEALAEQPDREKYSTFENVEYSVETHAGSRQPAQGEAVARVNVVDLGGGMTRLDWKDGNWWHRLAAGTHTLYTAPPAPSVPDEMASSPTHGEYSSGFVNGWNHCRAAMLAASPEPRS